MPRSRFNWLAVPIVCLAASALVLGACSSGDSDPTTTTADAATESGSTASTDEMEEQEQEFTASSPNFNDGEAIPSEFTCDGANSQPGIEWENAPSEATELVLIVDDPDAPNGSFIHWVIWGLQPDGSISEGSVPSGAIEGTNGTSATPWFGPCPPPGGVHNYEFQLTAVSAAPNIAPGAAAEEVRSAIADSSVGETMLVGTYERT